MFDLPHSSSNPVEVYQLLANKKTFDLHKDFRNQSSLMSCIQLSWIHPMISMLRSLNIAFLCASPYFRIRRYGDSTCPRCILSFAVADVALSFQSLAAHSPPD